MTGRSLTIGALKDYDNPDFFHLGCFYRITSLTEVCIIRIISKKENFPLLFTCTGSYYNSKTGAVVYIDETDSRNMGLYLPYGPDVTATEIDTFAGCRAHALARYKLATIKKRLTDDNYYKKE